jgi:hypothetical protein
MEAEAAENEDNNTYDWADAFAKWEGLTGEEIDQDANTDDDDDIGNEDEDSNEGGAPPCLAPLLENITNAPPKRRQRTSIQYTPSEEYKDMDEEAKDKALFHLAMAEFGATAATFGYQVKWIKKGGKENLHPSGQALADQPKFGLEVVHFAMLQAANTVFASSST